VENAVLVETLENALIVRFNRPEIRSPLSIRVLEMLEQVLDRAAAEKGLDKIVFTGREDVFASGADLREIAGVTAATAREFALRGQNLMRRIAGAEPVTIAAVNGFCFGGALDLALACRRRIAAPNAQFSHPGANLGIVTGWGGTQRLPRLIGEAAALEMFLTAKRVSASEAARIGLVDEIAEEPLARALAAGA
jgi:enoyl-CoA hydratase